MSFKKTIPYLIAIAIFAIASLIYFSPVLQGKKLPQTDITQHIGMAKEIHDFRDHNGGDEAYWTNSAFGGMPSYVISANYPYDYVKKLDKLIRFLPRPAGYLFLYLISFFVLLRVLKTDWKLAIVGALGFGFSTYFIIILGVGHNSKAHAIGYMPLVLSGILLVFQKRYLVGFVLTAVAMALELVANHIQMTYYLMFTVIILGIVELIDAVKSKELKVFAKQIGVLIVAVVLAIGANAGRLMATSEYAKHSTRSKSELTIDAEGKEKQPVSGLSNEYITEYSYGKLETFNLLVPRFMGGTSYEDLEDSELENFLKQAMRQGLGADDANYLFRISSHYWGDQPIVAAPAYIGAVLIFLFIFGAILVPGKMKKWLVASVIFSILLSWGKNLSFVTDFFINYVPMYNKFRAVSSIQVIAELCVPILAILGIKELLSEQQSFEQKMKAFKWSALSVVGLLLIFVVGGTGLFSFETPVDSMIDEQVPGFMDAIVTDRKTLFFNDSLRSLVLVSLTAILILGYLKNKLKQQWILVGFALLMLFDLVNVNKRYFKNEQFTSARKVDKPFPKTVIDKEILKDKGQYRVIDLSKVPMTDGSTSYYHKSVGGYHAAKPRRYQELYDFHIEKGNAEVLNMLNVKYIIIPEDNGKPGLSVNDEANGNAWFVNNLITVDSANEEIQGLDSINTKTTAIIADKGLPIQYVKDSTASIKLSSYKTNELIYESKANTDQFAVFSETYYADGWKAFIDGKESKIYRVNYVLRGLQVPAGNHDIRFVFEPQVVYTGGMISLVSTILIIFVILGWLFLNRKQSKETAQ